ncbi:response regulator transcription factor [Rhizosphaericola mali]|uniref:Response regulator transcription factor n=1 Tax=Rhizosphaericola mali TaxID=2545455 RepID=A0A5P2G435_9BACT|nr:response regulator [Rhizosphaericola mali]QES88582.1 response regulator transcription factor [Rhizosphaericola mali]
MNENENFIYESTILIVDDNEEILDFLQEDLNEYYNTICSNTALKALNILDTTSINLIISDIMMPEMDGFEFCKIIKSNMNYSHIPIILLTAKNTIQSKIEGLELGADAYIEKPFSPKHLQVQIENLLVNRIRIKKYFASSPTSTINSIGHTAEDQLFLDKLNKIILENIENFDFNVNDIAESIFMSKSSLYRKIKGISDLSPNELINITRLKKAAELLHNKRYTIKEISEMVGFNSITHFGRNFQKQFGMSPSNYQKGN